MKKPLFHVLYAALCSIFFFGNLNAQDMLDVQGHRGARGLMPENTIPAFIKALEIGASTLELDAVISRDKQVVVSHEPFLSHIICYSPEGLPITEEEEKDYNLYEMTYEEISQCDCGSRVHPRFAEQQKLAVGKPLLSEVIEAAETYVAEQDAASVYYNIETKSRPSGDNIFHPEPAGFVDLIMEVVREKGIEERVILQSFDIRTLQYAHEAYPGLKLALLIENVKSARANVSELGFVPDIYSPYYRLLNKKTMKYAREEGMKVIPWTVNKPRAIKKMIRMGVDGIISDYPDRVMDAVKE
jgi:glycerophosphoryl diester phosphodiesterase